MENRILVACALIAVIVLVALPLLGVMWHRRSRAKLRRRGIKRYGH